MKKHLSRRALATLAAVGTLCIATPVAAQVAGGTTTFRASVTESTTLAIGWSVKNSLMGKTVYNEADEKVGTVEDLIISPDRDLSFVIVGAGGFVGIGRHDVAIPVTRIREQAGRLVMAGATMDMIKDMPQFVYATQTSLRDAFVAAADADIARGKAAVSSLEKRAGAAVADTRTRIDADITTLQRDVTSAESKLSEMKEAGVDRWKQFEADVSAATARLRRSTEKAAG